MFCRYRSDNKEDGFQDFDGFIYYPGGAERLVIFLFLVFLIANLEKENFKLKRNPTKFNRVLSILELFLRHFEELFFNSDCFCDNFIQVMIT